MKRFVRRCVALLLITVLGSGLTIHAMGSSSEQENHTTTLFESAQSINEAVAALASYEDLDEYVKALYTLSDDDLISMIGNCELSGFARKLSLEVYAARIIKESNEAGALLPLDARFIAMVQDDEFDEHIKAEIIAFLNSFFVTTEAQAAITACAESTNSYLAVQSLKAIKKYDWQKAEAFADDILDNYLGESDSKVNIALKIKTYAVEQYSALQRSSQTKERAFVEKCEEISKNATSSKVLFAAQTALESMGKSVPVVEQGGGQRNVNRVGYAAFRDGVAYIEWHSGIIVGAEGSAAEFAHAPGGLLNPPPACYANYAEFLNGNEQKGYYWSSYVTATGTRRDAVAATARRIADAEIAYTVIQSIIYNPLSATPGVKYSIDDITAIRCDGLTEYAFEYNNCRLFGPDDAWDITLPNQRNQEVHNSLWPTTQAAAMTRIGDLR